MKKTTPPQKQASHANPPPLPAPPHPPQPLSKSLPPANPHNAAVRCSYQSPLGEITLAARGDALVGLWFNGQKHQPDFSQWPVDTAHPVLLAAGQQLAEYFAGTRCSFAVPLDLRNGTVFQQTVWQALRSIGPGKTATYGEVAQAIGKPQAVRAVGSAVGKNPVSIIVPCHRVLGSNGALTGYAGGIERKVMLLQLESVQKHGTQGKRI